MRMIYKDFRKRFSLNPGRSLLELYSKRSCVEGYRDRESELEHLIGGHIPFQAL